MIKLKPEEKSIILIEEEEERPFSGGNTFLISQVLKRARDWLSYSQELIDEGIECELLQPGSQGWIKGKFKLRLSLEFIPDDPEVETVPQSDAVANASYLDEIRQMND